MKKVAGILGAVVLVVVLAFVAINLIDEEPDPANVTLADLGPCPPGKENAYYLLWALFEPPDVDITSEKVLGAYASLAGSQGDRKKNYLELSRKYSELGRHYQSSMKDLGARLKGFNLEGDPAKEDLVQQVSGPRGSLLMPLDPHLGVLVHRFSVLMRMPVYHDMTPIVNLMPSGWFLPSLRISRLYVLNTMKRAVKGDWDGGTQALVDLVSFAGRGMKGSRSLPSELLFQAIMRSALIALNELMNQEQCPSEVFEKTALGLRTLSEGPLFAPPKSLVSEVLLFEDILAAPGLKEELPGWLWKLTFHRNRSINRMNAVHREIRNLWEKPPYQWNREQVEDLFKAPPERTLWWVRNMSGRLLMGLWWPGRAHLVKTLQTKVTFSLTLLAAELHQAYRPGQSIPSMLAERDPAEVCDPCSGEPFRWHEREQVLYSVGMDGKDQKGTVLPDPRSGDFALRVRLHGERQTYPHPGPAGGPGVTDPQPSLP